MFQFSTSTCIVHFPVLYFPLLPPSQSISTRITTNRSERVILRRDLLLEIRPNNGQLLHNVYPDLWYIGQEEDACNTSYYCEPAERAAATKGISMLGCA
jgi:hypothetical protein